jgi:flagellar biosynthesis protein FlhF
MKTMTFQAQELKDALAQVRQRLGPDALILSTREVTPLLGLGRPVLEVVAAVAEPAAAPARTQGQDPAPAAERVPAPSSGTGAGRGAPAGAGAVTRLLNRVSPVSLVRDRQGGAASFQAHPGHAPAALAPAAPAAPAALNDRSGGRPGPGPSAAQADETDAALQARLQPLQREVRALRSQLNQVAQAAQVARSAGPSLKQEVDELRAVLKTLGAAAERTGELTPEVAHLLNLGLERPLAEALYVRARELAPDGDFAAALRRAVAERVLTAGPVGVSSRVAAFVGPTGVGKTTTIAKIAARASLMDGARVALVTIDTFRVGAIDQLQRYADLMELPLHVAGTSAALRAAVQSNSGADLILVDTAGRGPRDAAQLSALRELLGAAEGMEVHLCLAATTRSREQHLALQSYRGLQPTRLCVTKLDEAVGLGEVLSLSESARLPLSYFGTGQRVPEDLELCTPEGFAARLLSGAGFAPGPGPERAQGRGQAGGGA